MLQVKSDRVEIIDLTLSDQEEESRTDSAASVAPESPSKSHVLIPITNPTRARSPINKPIISEGSSSGTSSSKPKRTLKIISLAEQRQLTATANRFAKLAQPKRNYCRICKVFIYKGFIESENRSTLEQHNQSKAHLRNCELKLTDWQKGCSICKITKFNCRKDYLIHLAGGPHKREFARQRRLALFDKPEFLKNPEFKVHYN